MLPEEKRAWFIIAMAVLAVTAVLVLIPVVGVRFAWAGLAVYGLGGFAPLIGGKRRDGVTTDERDRMIAEKAGLAGGLSSYSWFVLGSMGAWLVFMLRGQESVPVEILPFLVIVGGFIFFTVHSITVVVLYRRHRSPAEA